MPAGVTDVPANLYNSCFAVSKVILPDGLQTIGKKAFAGCRATKSIVVPEGVTTIGDGAFSVCDRLTDITLPDTVTSLGHAVFSNCLDLKRIKVSDANPTLAVTDGVLFVTPEHRLAACTLSAPVKYVVPEGTLSIDEYAFENNSRVREITLPSTMTEIAPHTFLTSALETVTLPESITTIGESAFSYCYRLKTVHLSEGLTTIGESAFDNCGKMTEVAIPASVTSIGKDAFGRYHAEHITFTVKAGSYGERYAAEYERDYGLADCVKVIVE